MQMMTHSQYLRKKERLERRRMGLPPVAPVTNHPCAPSTSIWHWPLVCVNRLYVLSPESDVNANTADILLIATHSAVAPFHRTWIQNYSLYCRHLVSGPFPVLLLILLKCSIPLNIPRAPAVL